MCYNGFLSIHWLGNGILMNSRLCYKTLCERAKVSQKESAVRERNLGIVQAFRVLMVNIISHNLVSKIHPTHIEGKTNIQ